jgi:prepilin peptidase CpaA
MIHLPVIVQVLLGALVGVAAIYDIRWRRIPNWLVLTGLLVGLTLNPLLYGWTGLKLSLLGLGLAMLVYFPLYAVHGMGAGDVKLMAAIGAIAGPDAWFNILLLTAVLGAAIALLLLLLRGRLRSTLWNVGYIISELMRFRAPYLRREELDVNHPTAVTLPHGATIALGCLCFLVAAALR